MKLSHTQLKQIIKEELERAMEFKLPKAPHYAFTKVLQGPFGNEISNLILQTARDEAKKLGTDPSGVGLAGKNGSFFSVVASENGIPTAYEWHIPDNEVEQIRRAGNIAQIINDVQNALTRAGFKISSQIHAPDYDVWSRAKR